MTQYLFLFTIGPVQSFIAQARKTQDLYAGSFLLSHLTDFAMKELKKVNNCKFIFPNEEIKQKPNRFIATIESDDVEKVGKELKVFVEKEFKDIAGTILKKLNMNNISNDFRIDFDNQIKTYFQVNWATLPLKEGHYADTYKELESYIGAIKNVRIFHQLKETGRKCSLCGERNVLFYRGRKRAYTIDTAISLDRQSPKYMSDGEGLCAVCFTKRFADKYFEENSNYTVHFSSTAKIAAMDWLTKIPDDKKKRYMGYFNNFDEQLYYDENLRRKYMEKYGHFKDELSLLNAKKQLKELYELIGKPPQYYALVMLDGDDMGKWLSGEFLRDKMQLLNFHKNLTIKLGSFASSLDGIIKEPKGKLVYAGGDDLLAFINLNHLLHVIKELRERFPKFEKLGFDIKDNHKSTASAGIVIAHYKTPLSEVLKWTRKMEKESKAVNSQKDAFAIAVLKRSGEIRKTAFKWQYNISSTIEILDNLIKSLHGYFSNTFIKNLGLEFKRLMDGEGKFGVPAIFKTEIKRLIERSCNIKKIESETKEEFLQRKKQTIDDLTEELNILYINSKSLDNFLSALDIADFIERGGKL